MMVSYEDIIKISKYCYYFRFFFRKFFHTKYNGKNKFFSSFISMAMDDRRDLKYFIFAIPIGIMGIVANIQ